MPMNTKIVSVIDGKITRAEYNSTMGYFVEVTGKAGVKTRYLHLNKILVTKGARVTRGGAIALNIFRERLRNDIPARAKNGQPHHNTTGEARSNCSHVLYCGGTVFLKSGNR